MAKSQLSRVLPLLLFAWGCEGRAAQADLQAVSKLAMAERADPKHVPLVQPAQARGHGPYVELPTPAGATRERCPDELLPREWESDAQLRVRVRDARVERRDLLPLDLKLALDSERALDAEGGAKAPRYLAELLVEDYAGPRLFRRLNAPRSEWAAGKLIGRIVVHDLEAERVLCQAPVSVRGDAAGVSIRRRLRDSTRRALEKKLQEQARSQMISALAQISAVLRLESVPARRNSG